jgi:hypothetical protein
VRGRVVVAIGFFVSLMAGFALGILAANLPPPHPAPVAHNPVLELRQCIGRIPNELVESVRLFHLKTPKQRAISYLLLEANCVDRTIGGVDPGALQQVTGLTSAPDDALLK